MTSNTTVTQSHCPSRWQPAANAGYRILRFPIKNFILTPLIDINTCVGVPRSSSRLLLLCDNGDSCAVAVITPTAAPLSRYHAKNIVFAAASALHEFRVGSSRPRVANTDQAETPPRRSSSVYRTCRREKNHRTTKSMY